MAVFHFLRKPYTTQGVLRLVRRHADVILFVHSFSVGVARSRRDPDSVASAKNRFQCRHQPPPRHPGLSYLPFVLFLLWLTIRHHKKRALVSLTLNARSQSLRRPDGLSCLAQASLLFRGGPGVSQASSQIHNLAHERSEKTSLRPGGTRHHPASPYILHPLGCSRNRENDCPADYQHSDQDD